jgi:hypothetical protein
VSMAQALRADPALQGLRAWDSFSGKLFGGSPLRKRWG